MKNSLNLRCFDFQLLGRKFLSECEWAETDIYMHTKRISEFPEGDTSGILFYMCIFILIIYEIYIWIHIYIIYEMFTK